MHNVNSSHCREIEKMNRAAEILWMFYRCFFMKERTLASWIMGDVVFVNII